MPNLITWFGLAVAGWCAGALVNYFSDVLPWKRRLSVPLCLSCQASQGWVNYLFWPRRCQSCRSRRGWRAWVVEVAYMFVAWMLWQAPPASLGFWVGLVLLIYFGVIVVVDIEYRLILNEVSWAGVLLASIVGISWRAQRFAGASELTNIPPNAWGYGIWTTLAGGALGFGLMWLLYALGEIFVRFVAHRRGQPADEVALGFGDVNLSGVLGLLLGWPLILAGLFTAILVGGVVSLLYLLVTLLTRRYHVFMALPYGPFLVSGAVFVIYFRDFLLQMIRAM